jgi:shikimate dehydrogenase
MLVTGTTEIIGIIGTPIVQVKSPGVINRYFQEHRLNRVLVPMHIRPDGIPAFIETVRRWQNLRGIIVTVPYKQVLAPLMDRLTDRAALFSTINVFRRNTDGTLEGEMLDGVGFVAAQQRHDQTIAGKSAAVVGAGGVASAITGALCENGIARLAIQDQDTAKQARLIATLRAAFPRVAFTDRIDSLRDTDLLVNATPVGMNGDPNLPLPEAILASLPGRCFVADVVTAPAMTPFLILAQTRGCGIQQGVEMTETQLLPLTRFLGMAA